MVQVGDIVEHTSLPNGVGIVIEKWANRYRVKWIRSPFISKHTDTWSKKSQVKLMENK
jgi:hypothetical protein